MPDHSSIIVSVCPFRYKKIEDKAHYISAMEQILPLLYTRMIAILPHQTEFYVTLQHWILKIFYCTMHVRIYIYKVRYLSLSLSLSLAHTRTHTHSTNYHLH